jgi:hypothetical protein
MTSHCESKKEILYSCTCKKYMVNQKQTQVKYSLSKTPKSENLQNQKYFARRHEHNAVQMWILLSKFNSQFEIVIKFNAPFVLIP